MKKKSIIIIICIMSCWLLWGCKNADKDAAPEPVGPNDNNVSNEMDASNDKPGSQEDNPKDNTEDGAGKDSLAKRMTGRYSYHAANEDGEEEFYIMDVMNFGDNLYAFCGQAYPEDYERLEAYSFWASEFIPYDADEIKSTVGDTVKVNELRFSVMSNLGKYWDGGISGTITLTDDGLVFEGFGHDGFLVPDYDDSRLFLKDDRVEGAFPYLKHDESVSDSDLQGMWIYKDPDGDLYIEFSGSDIYIYRKCPNAEVFFAAGGYETHDGSFAGKASQIENGGMPFEFNADYKLEGDTLAIVFTDLDVSDRIPKEVLLEKTTDRDVHVTTMDEVLFDENSFGAAGWSEQEPFFGLWVEAFKEKTDAEDLVAKLEEKGLPASYVYSCDWENLNKEPYYCVTIGRSGSEPEAQSYINDAKTAGYGSAYVKYTGERIGHRVYYTVYDESDIDISLEKAVIKDVNIEDLSGDDIKVSTLIVDADTTFDKTCELQFFSYYQKGETPLEWFNHIKDLQGTEEYGEQAGALIGIFEVDITGNHIDRYYGSYWWD